MNILQSVLATTLLLSVSAQATTQTDDAIKLATKWQKSSIEPIMGDDGRVLFAYGMSQLHVVCAPLKICDIALQPGELVHSVKAGDSARWVIDGAVVGKDDNRREHIIIKPKGAGLENTLFVATDRRSYSINLISHPTDNMGKVGFTYNDGVSSTQGPTGSSGGSLYSSSIDSDSALQEIDVVSDRDILGGNLNFEYNVDGDDVKWRPVRVYDDGIKTFIDFDPVKIQSREMPALMIYDTNALGAVVNYRVQRSRYIVDSLFDEAGLVLGVGRKQAKISIRRGSSTGATDQPYGQP